MMQNTSERKMTEDAPRMRSCLLLPQRSNPLMPFPMAMSMPIRRPFSIAQKKIHPRSSGQVINKTTDSDNKSTNNMLDWKVAKLERIPKIHVLERTHVSVSNATAQEVARRITDCFQKESIKANFDDLRAVAEGETIDHIHFAVRLFATDCAKQVVVEVQRVLGCSYGFVQIAKIVLNAAKCIRRSQPPNRVPPSLICNIMIPTIAADQRKNEESIVESLELSLNMLKSNRFDTNEFALDILLQLTSNSNNTNSAYGRSFAASKILSGSFLKTLLLLTVNGTPTFPAKHQHSIKMHRHALTILANCLDATEKSRNLGNNDVFCSDKVCLSLFEKLKGSSTEPHEAYQATRCLRSLLRSYVQVRRLASIHNIADATICAFNNGTASHAMLEKESQKLRISLALNDM